MKLKFKSFLHSDNFLPAASLFNDQLPNTKNSSLRKCQISCL